MKKLSQKLISLFLCICMMCVLLPTALAVTGKECTVRIQYDKDRYDVGETVTAHVMVKQNGGGAFDLYYFGIAIVYDTDYLTPVDCESDVGKPGDVVFNSGLTHSGSYKRTNISYNKLGTPVSCTADANGEVEVARLNFTAKANTPDAGTTMGYVISDGKAGQIAIGATDIYYPSIDDITNGVVHIGAIPATTYSVTYDLNGAEGTAPTEADHTKDSVFRLAAAPTRDGYEFLGWNDGTKNFDAGAEYTMPDNNVTFTAQWKQTKFMVRYEANGATSGTVPKEESILAGTKINVQTSDLKRDGYDFGGWLCSFDNAVHEAGYTFTMPEKNVTITAQWKEKTTPAPSPGGNGSGSGGVTSYPVTVNSPANGTAAADKKSAASGATVTITVTPETGYKVGTVTVKDKNGKTIAATEKDGKYSFQMPASAVSVDVTFVKDGQSSVGDCPKDSTCPVDPFKDTANNAWWHDGIHYCVQQGLMNGVASDQFAPNGTTTRAMIVTILWRMEGSPATSYGMSFTDVPAGQWYTEAIRWAQSTGVVTGYDAKTFGPNDNVTREQLAAILYRYTAHKGGDVSKRSTLAQFTDVNQISSWALENIQWANAVGMVNGRTDTTIVPKGNATRAEAASMIQRFCQNVLKL